MKQPEFIFLMHNAKIDSVVQGELETVAQIGPAIFIKHYFTRNDKVTVEFPIYNKIYVVGHKQQLMDVIGIYQKGENVETRLLKYCDENFKTE